MTSKGFTIVELLLSISIATIISGVMLYLSLNMFGDVVRARQTAELAHESQQLLRAIIEDVRLAGSLSSTNQNSDPYAPSGGWQTNDPSNILIIDSPAIDSSRNIIYNNNTGLPYDNEVVYYSNSKQMYRRILTDPLATNNNVARSCPPASATSTCPADRLYSNNLSDLSFQFFDEANTTTANATLARSVQITVKLEKRIYGTPVTFTNTIRTTLRNR